MSVAVIPMARELGWTATERGLVSSAFFWGYSLTQIPAGWISTRCPAAPPACLPCSAAARPPERTQGIDGGPRIAPLSQAASTPLPIVRAALAARAFYLRAWRCGRSVRWPRRRRHNWACWRSAARGLLWG